MIDKGENMDSTGAYVAEQGGGRCIGCRHPSGSRCGGCGIFVNDGWDGQVRALPRCPTGDEDRGCPVCGECEDADDTGHCYTCHRTAREHAATSASGDVSAEHGTHEKDSSDA